MQVTIVGIDLAKNVFCLHGCDTNGKPVLRKQLARRQLLGFLANLPRGLPKGTGRSSRGGPRLRSEVVLWCPGRSRRGAPRDARRPRRGRRWRSRALPLHRRHPVGVGGLQSKRR
jgi:hypothetical protein